MTTSDSNGFKQKADEVLLLDPDREATTVETTGIDWAEKDETASHLEESKKPILAQIILRVMQENAATGKKPMSMAQAESLALADEEYKVHIKGMTAARGEANKARVKYDTARARLDLLRSLVAAKREEMRLGGVRT